MTVQEAVCHMSDQLRVALGDLPTSGEPGRLARTLGKWFVLYMRFRSPVGVSRQFPRCKPPVLPSGLGTWLHVPS